MINKWSFFKEKSTKNYAIVIVLNVENTAIK
jgi:hypothetical protein